jgi:mannose-1-phosphate guanylyltransferase
MNNNNFCVIMAGGIGSRFWPLSRTNKPKQFLDILGTGKTLLQQTFLRFSSICPTSNIYIVTSNSYKDIVLEQLPEISENQVLLEPMRKNTAPCIAYATFKIKSVNPLANIIVAPSDHLILNEAKFVHIVEQGLEFSSKNNALLTLGMKPNRPETGYGYIQVSPDKNAEMDNIRKVKTFTEKPNYDMARLFYESGEFYWNSGIFILSLSTLTKSFIHYLPEVFNLFASGEKVYNTPEENNFIKKVYSECKNISIDYGIMEKADNVFVLCTDFGWTDLGTWGSLYENSTKDQNKNVINGKAVLTYGCNNCIVKVPTEKLVVLQGLEDYIVVESDNILLICQKKDEQQIRQFVTDVKLEKGEDYV